MSGPHEPNSWACDFLSFICSKLFWVCGWGGGNSFHRYLAILIYLRVPFWERGIGRKKLFNEKGTIILWLKIKIYEITFFLILIFLTDFKSVTCFSLWFPQLKAIRVKCRLNHLEVISPLWYYSKGYSSITDVEPLDINSPYLVAGIKK